MSEGARICPLCAEVMDDAVCPQDGCPTVDCAVFEEQEEALKPGTVIANRFEIVKLLGKGAMGSVFLGNQLSMSRQVAIKTLQKGLVSDQDMVRRFYLEARAASQLEHPNIVKIYDFGVDEETAIPYIAMEFVDGGTLDEHLPLGQGMPEIEACRLLMQVAKGLVEAHDKGVVHRDLKPDNIYVRVLSDGDEQVKILDFGIAKVVHGGSDSMKAMTQTGMTLGTPAFMAPEQIRAEEVDSRTDLYSLGCILHQLLVGGGPFSGTENLSIMLRHLSEPVPVLPDTLADGVPPTDGIRALHAALLQKSPDDRPASTASVAKAFKILSRGEELDAEAVLGEVGAPVTTRRSHTTTADGLAATGVAGASGFANTAAVGGLAVEPTALGTAKAVSGTAAASPGGSRVAPVLVALGAVVAIGVAVAWPSAEPPQSEVSASTPQEAAGTAPTQPVPQAPPSAKQPGTTGTTATVVQEDPAAPSTVKVTIRSVPVGARVIWEGRVLGLTDLDAEFPQGGLHTVSLEKEGYTRHHLDFKAEPGTTVRGNLNLEPSAPAEPKPVKAERRPRRNRANRGDSSRARGDRASRKPETKPAASPKPAPKRAPAKVKRIQVPKVNRIKLD